MPRSKSERSIRRIRALIVRAGLAGLMAAAAAGGGPLGVALAVGADNLIGTGGTSIGATPFTDSTDTTTATREAGEFGTCGNFPGAGNTHSVWYRYLAGSSGWLTVDTLTSDYDTVLEVYTSTVNPPVNYAQLTSVACNDDAGPVTQSSIALPVSAGVTYYVMARDYSSGLGGNLVFNAAFSTVQQIFVNRLTGNDSNPGTPALPVKTVQRGVDLASPGAIVNVVAGGTYGENVTIDRSLTLSATTAVTTTSFTLTNGAIASGSTNIGAPTVYVNQAGQPGALLQDGVLLAHAGGTLNVAAGTYTASVTIGKSLTVQGPAAGPRAIIDPPGGDAVVVTSGLVTLNHIDLNDAATGLAVTGGSGVTLFRANVTGNAAGVTSTGPAVTATGNWWGDPTGPAHASNPLGQGQGVGNNVSFSPWCMAAAPACTPLTGTPTQLVYTVPPTDTQAGAVIAPPIVVEARDPGGARALSFNRPVTISIGANPGPGSLSGTTVVTAVSGVITYTNLSIDNPGDGYTLVAATPSLTSATSSPFRIFNNPPTAVDDTFGVNEDSGANALDVRANDLDDSPAPPAGIVIIGAGSPANGGVLFNSTTITYTPNPNYYGTDVFTYTITDIYNSGQSSATVTVTVANANDPPNAVDDTASVFEDSGANAIPVLSNDTYLPDPFETLTITAAGPATSGLVNITGGGTGLTYTPAPDFYGTATFVYTITDGALTDSALVTVTVMNVNDPPNAVDDTASIPEDSGATAIPVLSNDTYLPDPFETLTITAAGPATTGTVLITGGGTGLTYQPPPDFFGTAVFTYTITDGALTDSATVTVTVTSVNDPPNAVDDTAGVLEDSTNNPIAVLANDSFAPDVGETLTIVAVGTPSNGAAIFSASVVSYTPGADFYGTAVFTYTIADGNGGFDTATVTVTVTNVNDPPNAVNDTASVLEDSGATAIPVLSNDTYLPDPFETLTITAAGPATFGTVLITGGGTGLTYQPPPNFNGSATFPYTITDGALTDTAIVTVTVTAVNDPPSFTAGGDDTVNEDSGARSVPNWASAISAGPADESSQTLTFLITTTNNALFAVLPAVSAPTGTLTYTPAPNAYGVVTVGVRLQDSGGTANGGQNTSATQTFVITINPVNDAPSFTNGGDRSVLEDAGPQTFAGWAAPVSPGPNESGQIVTFTVTNTNPSLFSAAPDVAEANGNLTFTPAVDANGTATVFVTLRDDGGTALGGVDTFGPLTFVITVTAVNDAPSFAKGADPLNVNEDSGQYAAVWATSVQPGPATAADEAGQALAFGLSNNNPALFSVQPTMTVMGSTGVLTFTPAADAYGSALVTAVLRDNGGTLNGGVDTFTQTFTINVQAVNDPPNAIDDTSVTVLEDSLNNLIDVLANDRAANPDGPGEPLTVTSVSPGVPFFGSVAISPTNGAAYTPTADMSGSAVFHYVVSDGVLTDTAMVIVNVRPVNDAPTFVLSSTLSVPEDSGAQSIPNWATALSPGPPDEASQTLTFQTANNNPGLFSALPTMSVSGSNGTLNFTPAPNAFGTAIVTVSLGDNGGTADGGVDTSVPQTFTLTITPVNDPFNAVDDSASVLQDSGPNPIAVLANDMAANVDGSEPLTITAVTQGLSGVVVITGGGTGLTYQPNPGFNGPDSFSYTATDGVYSDTATVSVLVSSVAYRVYLPAVMRNAAALPDLVASFSLSPASPAAGQPVTVTVVITNQGAGSASNFWLDFYINPSTAPTAPNLPWNTVCGLSPCYGIAWYYSGTLAAGQSATLISVPGGYCGPGSSASNPQGFCAGNTIWPGAFAAGTSDLYLFVDSFNPGVASGSVLESNEGNNRSEQHGLAVAGAWVQLNADERRPEDLPPRPTP